MKKIKNILLVIFVIFAIFIAYLILNTFNFKSKQSKTEAIERIEINSTSKLNFSNSLKIKTISPENKSDFDSIQFQNFEVFLKEAYPLTDSLLEKKTFNSFSFLYKWKGSDQTLKPIILMAHLDVVPVIEENLSDWKHPPFSGKIINDTIWGRGAIDDKVNVVGIMEAVEFLLNEGFKPQRTIYISLGHDEEIGGTNGARAIANHLKENDVKAEFVLDEGGFIVQQMIPGIKKNVALIGIAEKGYVSLNLSIKLEGGHSSMPENETAIDVLSEAIVKLKRNPFPERISVPIENFIDYIGPEMPFLSKLVFANKSIFSNVITGIYKKSASGNALVRTTTSPTIFNSGVKDNILPQFANTTINFRILPGETISSVLNRVNKILNDKRITITTSEFASEPSKISSTNSLGFKILHKTISAIYPTTIVAPYLVVGGTDSRHFNEISNNIYRFSAVKLNKGNIKSFHGLNERLPISDFKNTIQFYLQLIKNSN